MSKQSSNNYYLFPHVEHFLNEIYFKQYAPNTDLIHLVFTIIHGLIVSNANRNRLPANTHWLKSLVLTMLMSTGGTTLSCLFLFKRPAYIGENVTMPITMLCWFLMNYGPLDIIRKVFYWPPFVLITLLLDGIINGISIVGGIYRALDQVPNSVFAAIVSGTLNGCGGRIMSQIEQGQRDSKTKTEFSKPSFAIKSAFFTTVFYYITTDIQQVLFGGSFKILPPLTAEFLIVIFYLFHNLFFHFMFEYNPFYLIETGFYMVTRIPQPSVESEKIIEEKKKN